MARNLIFLFVYLVVSNASPYCKYPDLQNFPAPIRHTPIPVSDFNHNCLEYPSFNASIVDSSLHVEACVNAQYQIGGAQEWNQYSSPVPLKKGQYVFVKCEDSKSVLLVNPPKAEDVPSKGVPSPNPSVFVVMVDAVAVEVLHRLMPNTVNMLKKEVDVEVYEFTKYPLHYLKITTQHSPHFRFITPFIKSFGYYHLLHTFTSLSILYDYPHIRHCRIKLQSQQVRLIRETRL